MKLVEVDMGKNICSRYDCGKCGYRFPMYFVDKDGNYVPHSNVFRPGTHYNYCPMCGEKVDKEETEVESK